MTLNKVYGYFSKNNYEYLSNLKTKLEQDKIKATKSKLLELGLMELKNKEYEEIKDKIGEML